MWAEKKVIASLSILFAFAFALFTKGAKAQDTLPNFSVVNKAASRNLVSWTNPYPFTSQISIQRSTDSLRNFTTILSVPDANVPQNGFVDTRADTGRVYYRLFVVLDKGRYLFTKSRRPAPDTAISSSEPILQDNQRVVLSDSLNTKEVITLQEKLKKTAQNTPRPQKQERYFVVRRKDVLSSVNESNFKRFRDSIVYTTRDTMVFEAVDTVVIKPFVPKEIYRASRYVYTERYGNVMIALPEAGKKKYSIRFFEDYNNPVFEIEEITSSSLVVDKTNFVHSGWFWFELYENGKMKERHKFFIPKDF
jgi:hypothetical protein